MSKTGDVAGVTSGVPGEEQVEDDSQSTVKIVKVRKNLDGNQEASGRVKKDSADYQFTGVNPGKMYMHPPSRLINGRIIYQCKYLGHLRVPEARGTEILREAIDKLKTVAEVNKANLEEDLPEVDLSVSIRSLVTMHRRTKKAIHQHPLPLVSFSADDKRGKGNMFAYISRGKPPATEHICYVYQCSATQAPEITATVGQAFELAYKKFLETKQAQEDFKRLKAMLAKATPEEKVVIEKKLVEVNKIRATEAERKKKMAAIQAKMPDTYVKPVTKIEVKGTKGAGLYTGSGKESTAMFENGENGQSKGVQKEVKELELESERQRQKALNRKESTVESKWERITEAMEPFQLEPSMEPGTQHLVRRLETKELDSVITDLEKQMEDLEMAFDWRKRKGQNPVPMFPTLGEGEKLAIDEETLEYIDGQMWAANTHLEDMEIPDLPANYVMNEFVKAREQAALPKKGTVKNKADTWLEEHHD